MKLCLHDMKRSETVTLDDISIVETDSREMQEYARMLECFSDAEECHTAFVALYTDRPWVSMSCDSVEGNGSMIW